jgi:hypothetical protein
VGFCVTRTLSEIFQSTEVGVIALPRELERGVWMFIASCHCSVLPAPCLAHVQMLFFALLGTYQVWKSSFVEIVWQQDRSFIVGHWRESNDSLVMQTHGLLPLYSSKSTLCDCSFVYCVLLSCGVF